MHKIALLCVILCAAAPGHSVDKTLEPKAHGRDVVEAVVDRIQKSNVFSDDKDYLRRVAYVESRFGDHSSTYRSGYYGGIWQVDSFKATQQDWAGNVTSPALKKIHKDIKEKMDIDWMQVNREDLLKPFYSGLAARIYIALTEKSRGPIPDDIAGQDRYWKDWYNTKAGKGKYGDFESRVREMLKKDMTRSGGRIDLMMVIDGSGSIGRDSFKTALDSVAGMAGSFDRRQANIGVVVFSDGAAVPISLVNNLTAEELQQTIQSITYPDDATNTYAGIMAAVGEFRALPADRKAAGVPRVINVFTDGKHNRGLDPAYAAEEATKEGIVCNAFGIGYEGIDRNELEAFTSPTSGHIFSTLSYDTLSEQISQIARKTKTVPLTPQIGSVVKEEMAEVGDKRYYRLGVPSSGTTITLNEEKGSARGYWSYTVEQPSSALYDGVLTNGKTFIPAPPSTKPGQRRRRDTEAENSTEAGPTDDVIERGAVFIAIESLADNTTVTMKTDPGDVSAATSLSASHIGVVIFSSSLTLIMTRLRCL